MTRYADEAPHMGHASGSRRAAVPALLSALAFPLLSCSPAPTPLPPKPSPSASAAPCSSAAPCASASAAKQARRPDTLHDDVNGYDFVNHADLRQRIEASAFQYLRFVNRHFARRVCEHFADAVRTMPTVNLHGDAHLEQYAVTPKSFGLTDFDDATAGPAVIDLVRFGTSVQVVAKQRGWDAKPAIEAFFDGYRQRLREPKSERKAPDFVVRARSGFASNRLEFLADSSKRMVPLSVERERLFKERFARYVSVVREQYAELKPEYFALKRYGHLRGGVGSALAERLLIRVEGPSADAGDDVILESKELSDMNAVPCVQTALGGGDFRAIVGRARVGNDLDKFLAVVPRGTSDDDKGRPFWMQAWHPGYRELDVARDLATPEEMAIISRDVGAQLGRGHTVQIAAPFDAQLRRAQLDMLQKHDARIRGSIDTMTAETLRSWELFRKQLSAL
jgi:hypothetical protein